MINFNFILTLSGIVGYLSLSQEILWIRLISFATGGAPEVFGHVLGFFLFGIAAGAWVGKKVCETQKINPLLFVGAVLFVSSLLYYFSIPFIGSVIVKSITLGINISYFIVMLIAFLSGGIFPVLNHVGIKPGKDKHVGASVSRVYLANIIGSVTGPILTGFVLLNIYTVQQNILYISIATLLTGWLILFLFSQKIISKISISLFAVLMIAFVSTHDNTYHRLLEKYQSWKHDSYKYIVQNRSGIISVAANPDADIVFGGGIYDGRFNTDPVCKCNGIDRAYMIAALHPKPTHVLDIGLSSGSWVRVIANHKEVESLTVVEINKGYVEIIKNYPEHATLLNDPKIKLYFDDGRRWLNRNPSRKFDFIVMNTTFHWRNQITNLVSAEFLRLARQHLKAGGVIYYNTTGSEDIVYTAAQVFKYVARYSNFVAASDSPFNMTNEEKRANLLKFIQKGTPTFERGEAYRAVLENLVNADLSDKSDSISQQKNLSLITDDNMLIEFKKYDSSVKPYKAFSFINSN